jgi:hypothetical protein
MEVDLALGLSELCELKTTADELVRLGCRKREHLDVPPFELGKPAASPDLGLQSAHVALREHDPGFNIFERRPFGCDAK